MELLSGLIFIVFMAIAFMIYNAPYPSRKYEPPQIGDVFGQNEYFRQNGDASTVFQQDGTTPVFPDAHKTSAEVEAEYFSKVK